MTDQELQRIITHVGPDGDASVPLGVVQTLIEFQKTRQALREALDLGVLLRGAQHRAQALLDEPLWKGLTPTASIPSPTDGQERYLHLPRIGPAQLLDLVEVVLFDHANPVYGDSPEERSRDAALERLRRAMR